LSRQQALSAIGQFVVKFCPRLFDLGPHRSVVGLAYEPAPSLGHDDTQLESLLMHRLQILSQLIELPSPFFQLSSGVSERLLTRIERRLSGLNLQDRRLMFGLYPLPFSLKVSLFRARIPLGFRSSGVERRFPRIERFTESHKLAKAQPVQFGGFDLSDGQQLPLNLTLTMFVFQFFA
jgi:hypothetical protein